MDPYPYPYPEYQRVAETLAHGWIETTSVTNWFSLLSPSPASLFLFCNRLQCYADPLGGVKWECKPIHTYHTYIPNKRPYAITRLTANFMCGLISDLVICKFRKSMIIHDTKCPYWDQVSLNNTNQNQSKHWIWNVMLQYGVIIGVVSWNNSKMWSENLYQGLWKVVSQCLWLLNSHVLF